MAEKPQKTEIEILLANAASARANLGHDVAALRSRLDAPARIREALQEHSGVWIAGAAASGLVASRLLFRSKPKKVRSKGLTRGFLFLLLRPLFTLAAPALKIWMLTQMKSYFMKRA